MTQKTDGEKIKTCFRALGINDNKAYEILFAELSRLGNDERIPEQKGIVVQVLNDGQKLIAETIFSLIEKQVMQGTMFQSQLGNIKVEVGDASSHSEKLENIINLGNFDYSTERDKLVSRCNATIIGNRNIGDVIYEQEKAAAKKPYDSDIVEELTALREDMKNINDEIDHYETRFFVLFRQAKLDDAYDEKEFLTEKLNAIEARYQKEKSYRDHESHKRRARLSGIVKKEDILQGIKYLFTGRREELVRTTDENGKIVRNFVVMPQEDYFSQRGKAAKTGANGNDINQRTSTQAPKPEEYDDIDK